MLSDEDKNDFMDLLSLNSEELPVEDKKPPEEPKMDLETLENLDDSQIQGMVIVELLKTVGINTQVLEEMRDMVLVGGDADFAQAVSSLSKSQGDMLKVLSEFALQKERLKAQKDIKKLDIEGKKEIIEHKQTLEISTNKNNTTNNILVMGREEMFQTLFDEKDKPETEVIVKDTKSN